MPTIEVAEEQWRRLVVETGLSEQTVAKVLIAAARVGLIPAAQGELFGFPPNPPPVPLSQLSTYTLSQEESYNLSVGGRAKVRKFGGGAARKSLISEEETITPQAAEMAVDILGRAVDIAAVWGEFVSWHAANGVPRSRWSAAWKNWCWKQRRMGKLPLLDREAADAGFDLEAGWLRDRGDGGRGRRAPGREAPQQLAERPVDTRALRVVGGGPVGAAPRSDRGRD